MYTAILITQIIVGILLVLFILVQEKGSGFGEALGGVGGTGFQTSKRGAEKVLANLTIVLFVIFLILSLVLNFI